MKVTITGGLGFLGRLLGRRLAADGHEVTLFDLPGPTDSSTAALDGLRVVTGRLGGPVNPTATAGPAAPGGPTDLAEAIPDGTGAVVHLASMVSAECERDFDSALAVNLDGTRAVLERCRALPAPPRFVFASSVAVFGQRVDASGPAGDSTKQTPVTTYGMTKAIGELLVNEYSRRGWVDGRSARLPTVVIRPGRPNAAASSFASGLFREPLAGETAVVPVVEETPVVLIGCRRAVSGLERLLLDVPASSLGADRALALPGMEVTVGAMIAAARRHPATVGQIVVQPDAAITAVVASWPGRWDAARAEALGFTADDHLDRLIDEYLEDFRPRPAD